MNSLKKELDELFSKLWQEAERVRLEDERIKRRTERLQKREDALLALSEALEKDANQYELEAEERTDRERCYGKAEAFRSAARRIRDAR